MKYADMHCDTLTECFKAGSDLYGCGLQTSFKTLKKAGCAAQCFAVFTDGDEGAFLRNCLDWYAHMLEIHRDEVLPVLCGEDFLNCLKGEKVGCILTIENLAFLTDGENELKTLKNRGVRMISLVWNRQNKFAYPNLSVEGTGAGEPSYKSCKDTKLRDIRGLTPLGRATAEVIDGLKIILDISHLSDGGVKEILDGRKIPLVASHSCAASVCDISRNLRDWQIKKIADCGGAVGVNFCKDFLGEGESFECVYRHVRRLIDIGGEDVIAIGSDFDGIPPCPDLEDCTKIPELLNYLSLKGVGDGAIEKFAYKNFYRVFCEVCG